MDSKGSKLQRAINFLSTFFKEPYLKIKPKFRVLRIEKTEDDEFNVIVQLINKNQVFVMKAEDILANDALTDSFYPRDIRTLTYLGYLGINSPKYTILAKRFKENNQLVFALQEKKSKKILVKTSDEISANKDILGGLNQMDAHMVGFSTATDHVIQEDALMKKALSEHAAKLNTIEIQ